MLNLAVIEGRLVKEVQTNIVGGQTYAKTIIANDDWKKKTSFIEIKMLGRTADNAAVYLRKGSKIIAQGRLIMESWAPKPDGKKTSKLVLYADAIEYLSNRHDTSSIEDGGDIEIPDDLPSEDTDDI